MPKSSQLGYNHNIPHRGRLFHVQTEDSGREKAHIYTHVFHAGSIIATNKVLYTTDRDGDEFDAYVISLMQESHKALIRQLKAGGLDERIVMLLGPHPAASAEAAVSPPPSPALTAIENRADTSADTSLSASPASELGRSDLGRAPSIESAPALAVAVAANPTAPELAPLSPLPLELPQLDLPQLGLPTPSPLLFEPALAHPALLRLDPERTGEIDDFGPAATPRVNRRVARKTPAPRATNGAGSADLATALPLRDILLSARGRDESMDALDSEIIRHLNTSRRQLPDQSVAASL